MEEHVFIPNETNLTVEDAMRVNVQIALEINYKKKIKVVEISDSNKNLVANVIRSLENDPVVQVEAVLLSKDNISIPQVKVEDSPIENFDGVYMVIGKEILSGEKLKVAKSVLIENGFLLSREPLSTSGDYSGLNILTIYSNPTERLVLATKSSIIPLYQTLEITNDFNWVKPLQDVLATDDEVVIYSCNQNTGVIGLSNTLRCEGRKVRCAVICDPQAPTFKPSNELYHKQLKKGFATNVLKDGKWGTYRCLPTKSTNTLKTEHCFVKGDLESSNWVVGPLNAEIKLKPNEELIHVIYFLYFIFV